MPTPPAEQRVSGFKVLFFMEHLGRYLRLFDPVIRELLRRGHRVHLVFEREEAPGPEEEGWLREMAADPNFSSGVSESWRRDPWFRVARPIRGALDYVYFAQVGAERAPFLVGRAKRRSPGWGRLLIRLPGAGSARGLALIERVLIALDRSVPPSKRVIDLVRKDEADVVLLTPHLMPGSVDSHYVRSAAAAGVPTVVCVASWDNLSSKQLLRVTPDVVTVWNELQLREAVDVHGLPEDRIVVTGAQAFDQWFDWPPRPREEFCARVGLDPGKPYILYVGGALFPGSPTEAEWTRDWIAGLRSSGQPGLADAGVLVRPHPKRQREWEAVNFDELENVSVWPRGQETMPVREESRADLFDSIYHSAVVVGLNTSAMIEAAIVGKAVHTVLAPEFASSQEGTLHFRYLLEAGGGLLHVAPSLDEHYRLLAGVVSGEDRSGEEAARRFVATFVRPQGIDKPSTPLLVDTIEGLVARGARQRDSDSRWLALLRPLLYAGRSAFFMRRLRWKAEREGRRTLEWWSRAVRRSSER